MTREQDFLHHSERRWFALGGLYWPPHRFTDSCGSEKLAVQTLSAIDVESDYMLHVWPSSKEPAPFTAEEVIAFIDTIFAKYGPCSQGVVVMPSVWESTQRLYESGTTRDRVENIYQAGVRIDEMDAGHRFLIATHVQSLGLELSWDEDQIPNLDELLHH